jgi:hypothetical protein
MSTATAVPNQEAVNFPELDGVEQQGAIVLKESMEIEKITNDEDYRHVCMRLLEAAGNIKRITEHIEPHKKEQYARWKRICEVETRLTAPFLQVKTRGSQQVASYQHQQEQARLRAEEDARRKQQQEADALRAQQAEQLASEGRVEEGVAILEQETELMAPIVAPVTTPKVEGVSSPRKVYKARVKNFMELVKAVADGKVPLAILLPDESALNKAASVFHESMNYPGVEVYVEMKSSIRAR